MEQSEGTFHDAVLKICPHYFDLFDVMKDHSSSKPQIISQELNEIIVEPLTTDDEEDSSINNNNDTHPTTQMMITLKAKKTVIPTAGSVTIQQLKLLPQLLT